MPVFSIQIKQAAGQGVVLPSASNPTPDNSPGAIAERLQSVPVSVQQAANAMPTTYTGVLTGADTGLAPSSSGNTPATNQPAPAATSPGTISTISNWMHQYGLLGAGIAAGVIVTTLVIRKIIKKKSS